MASDQKAAPPKGFEFYGGYQVYSDSGIDLTLLRENRKRTIDERLKRNSRGVALARALAASSREGQPRIETPMSAQPFDPEPLLRALVDHQVEFVLIGGLAMRVHGSAHITEDMDICYRRSPENIERLTTALAPFHPYMRGAPRGLPFRFDPPTVSAGLNFTLTSDLGDIDVLGEVSGIGTFEQMLAQSEKWNVFGLSIHVLTLDGLLLAKRAAARLKDRNHILELEELKKMRDANP